MIRSTVVLCSGILWCFSSVGMAIEPKRLAQTDAWSLEGDPADQMISGIDRFLLKQNDRSEHERPLRWQKLVDAEPDLEAREAGLRERLQYCLGMRDALVTHPRLEIITTLGDRTSHLEVAGIAFDSVRWEVFQDSWTEGLLLRPTNGTIRSQVIVVPDAGQLPEALAGLISDPLVDRPLALDLARAGCQVLIPVLVDRSMSPVDRVKLNNREYLYRAAFGLGRHPMGYDVQSVLSGAVALRQLSSEAVSIAGFGEGGRVAMYAAALDPKIQEVLISGAFSPRGQMWQEPIDRNHFGLLNEFGDAEIIAMISPRSVHLEQANIKSFEVNEKGAAPGKLSTVTKEQFDRELDKVSQICKAWKKQPNLRIDRESNEATKAFRSEAVKDWANSLTKTKSDLSKDRPSLPSNWISATERQTRIVRLWDRWTQNVLEKSPKVRDEFMKSLDTSSGEAYAKTSETYRQVFSREIIGAFELPLLAPNPRSRAVLDTERWVGYEVMLDVWEDVFAYGYLLVPKDIPPEDRRPVVVCQHGLEGRPTDTIQGNHPAYHDFAARLAEQGYIVFAPQNPYLFHDRFRTLQRKANPLGKSLFSIIVPQHQQITRWLGSLPFVDAKRIGFYGLSYGGKSAMRIPALVPEYCLSICSADFNDWVWKLSSTRSPYSYVRTPEYEIFEFNLGSTFNYSEMAALIAPRPFMVERGHFDGVAPDDRVAAEYAKVRHLYAAKLGIGDQTEIEWFVGPHTINGKGTFEFLDTHLRPTRR